MDPVAITLAPRDSLYAVCIFTWFNARVYFSSKRGLHARKSFKMILLDFILIAFHAPLLEREYITLPFLGATIKDNIPSVLQFEFMESIYGGFDYGAIILYFFYSTVLSKH